MRPASASLFHLKHDGIVNNPVEEPQVGAVQEEIGRTAGSILSEEFEATPSYRACRTCDYRSICDKKEGFSTGGFIKDTMTGGATSGMSVEAGLGTAPAPARGDPGGMPRMPPPKRRPEGGTPPEGILAEPPRDTRAPQ